MLILKHNFQTFNKKNIMPCTGYQTCLQQTNTDSSNLININKATNFSKKNKISFGEDDILDKLSHNIDKLVTNDKFNFKKEQNTDNQILQKEKANLSLILAIPLISAIISPVFYLYYASQQPINTTINSPEYDKQQIKKHELMKVAANSGFSNILPVIGPLLTCCYYNFIDKPPKTFNSTGNNEVYF